MNILLIGSGGREHAIADALYRSKSLNQLFIAPGNPGTAALGTNVAIRINDFDSMKKFCAQEQVDMIVVGPEQPLVDGIVNAFEGSDVLVLGPDQRAAMLEGSKAFSKTFMQEYDVPTAAYREFGKNEVEEAVKYVADIPTPIVVKASGLAAGKGVIIAETNSEAQKAVREMMLENKFGEAGDRIVIEEYLDGIELSVFVLTDGNSYQILPTAKDYKRIGEGDTGLNTGGMGAVCPAIFADAAFMKKVEEKIVVPSIKGIQDRNMNYKGFLFIGLMKVGDEPYVIEYNVRMGDPETEVVFPKIDSDVVQLFAACFNGSLAEQEITYKPGFVTTVMAVSKGYPEAYEKGKRILGADQVSNAHIFHAGTSELGNEIVTSGGRVLCATAFGETIEGALSNSYAALDQIHFEGMTYRKDIGKDILEKL